MRVYTDLGWAIFMLLITLFLIVPAGVLMIPVAVGLSDKWLSPMVGMGLI
jgi:hypothetical protein